MQRSKVETFIGFSIKSGNLVAGANAIPTTKKLYGIYLCNTASDNSKKQAMGYANKYNVPLILVKGKSVEEILNKKNCKMFAIKDEALNNAIMANLDEDFEIIFRGGK